MSWDADRLAANLARISGRQPRLARAASAAAADAGRYAVEAARSGDATLRRGDLRLASAYDPRTEGRRAAEAVDSAGPDPVLALGFGAGWHVEALLERTRGAAPGVLVAEADLALLAASLGARDMAFLEDPHLWIVAPADSPIRVAAALRWLFDAARHRSIRLLAPPAARAAAPETYAALESLPAEVVADRLRDRLTRLAQEPAWFANAIANMPRLAGASSGLGLDGAGAGLPAFLVAAGPSLARNARALADVGDGGFVVAVDTAVRALESAGVLPHLAVAVDSNEANAADFEGIAPSYLARLVVAADPVVAPALLARHTGPTAVCRTENYALDPDGRATPDADPVTDLVEEVLGGVGRWQSGGSVATNAFDLAARMGCDPIVLVGFDLAYSGGLTHVADVGAEETGLAAGGRFATREDFYRRARGYGHRRDVPAVGGGTVETDEILEGYRRWLEDTVEFSYKGRRTVIDSTEGGAAKRGIPPAPLAETVRRYAGGRGAAARLAAALGRRLASAPEAAARLAARADRWRGTAEARLEALARRALAAFPA